MQHMGNTRCFKAYDIRGRIPDELDADLTRRIGAGFAELFNARQVVIGRDVRPSSAMLADALTQGLRTAGVEVLDIGLCGSEEIYFATAHLGTDGGIMITASHNPPDYNGLKFVRRDARPINAESGLNELARWVKANPHAGNGPLHGSQHEVNVRAHYIQRILGLINPDIIKPARIVVNAGNGCAGSVFDALALNLPLDVIRLQHSPDGTFPNGVPNPLLPKNRSVTAKAVTESQADFGIAWDGDFDRCFFFDAHGHFIEGYYLVGLLAAVILDRHPGAAVVHDPRLIWNTQEVVTDHGGKSIASQCGHAYIKEKMRDTDAVYGGEMSAHHYFRDFAYSDSGMIPWLLVLELLSKSNRSLSSLIAEMMMRYPISGEINRRVSDITAVLRSVESNYTTASTAISHLDGLSMEFYKWRFNLRASNTEPLIRLNVEAQHDRALMEQKRDEILALVGGEEG